MLARIALILIRVSYLPVQKTESFDASSQARHVLVSELSRKLRSLRLIFSTAPYLGLLGTCFDVVDTFWSLGSGRGALAWIATGVDAAFLSTAAGILVAVPATCLHNYLRTRVGLLEIELADNRAEKTRFPLRPRVSLFPFPLIAIPVLAMSLLAFMVFPSFFGPKGLRVRVMAIGALEKKTPSAGPIVISVVDMKPNAAPAIYVNSKKTSWDELTNKLRCESNGRSNSIVYVQADKDVFWKYVMDVTDAAKALHGEVVLLTTTPEIRHRRRLPR